MQLPLAFQAWEKEGFGTQAFHGHTTLHPLALLVLMGLVGAIFAVKRQKAVYPLLVAALFLPGAQRVVIAGADFSMMRLMVLAGMARVFMKGEHTALRWRKLDKLVASWCLWSTFAFIVLWASFGKFIFRMGMLYDMLGMYLFFRYVIRSWADVEGIVRFAVRLMPLLVFLFFIEKSTQRNPFGFLGAQEWATIREGRVRCQGAFPHAILAGTFFASWLPLVGARYWRPKGRMDAYFGGAMIMALVYLCASSTPIVGVMACGMGLFGWLLRRKMQLVRWSTVAVLFALHLVMKAPVWHLISRMSFSAGSTSYHRFLLIDNAIRYWTDWFLVGVKDTGYWGHAQGDVTNQFVLEGVRGGFLGMVLFIWVLSEAFRQVGRLWRTVERNRAKRALGWALGVSLFAQALMFLSISISPASRTCRCSSWCWPASPPLRCRIGRPAPQVEEPWEAPAPEPASGGAG
ncbi:MAG: hypothetical protein R3E96_14535 [Planctomycetota bacterium]